MDNMRAPVRRSQLTLRKKLLFTGILLGLLLVLAEIGLRVTGLGPYTPPDLAIAVEPGGRLYQLDEVRGYKYLPGEYSITLPTGWNFRATHRPDTLRATSPSQSREDVAEPRRTTWVFGCSYTYGWTVSDEETYVWLLQEMFPEERFVNFGVDGYGTVHSLYQFRQALEQREAPDVVVLSYADFHDMRSTLRRMQRKNLVSVNRLGELQMPWAWKDAAGQVQTGIRRVTYREWPLMRHSALVHTGERVYNKLELSMAPNHEITLGLIQQFRDECVSRGIPFVLAGIGPSALTQETLREFERQGVPTIDISVDRNLPENTNLPHDAHPSAHAHRQYAEKLGRFLRELPR